MSDSKETNVKELLERTWGIICNAGNGDWNKESPAWECAAREFRTEYFKYLDENHPFSEHIPDQSPPDEVKDSSYFKHGDGVNPLDDDESFEANILCAVNEAVTILNDTKNLWHKRIPARKFYTVVTANSIEELQTRVGNYQLQDWTAQGSIVVERCFIFFKRYHQVVVK